MNGISDFSWLIRQLRLMDTGGEKQPVQVRAGFIVHRTRRYGIRQVQHMAGHKHISSPEQYRRQDIESLREALHKYHPRG